MMDDPQTNYFETLKAFREYYKDRKLPKEPFENEEMEVFEKEVGLVTDKESEERREKKLGPWIAKRGRPGKIPPAGLARDNKFI